MEEAGQRLDMSEQKHVVFRLADELYGLPIESVERILDEQKTTRIPRTPKMMLGVFDLRGETIAAVDLRSRFEFPENLGPSNFIVALGRYGRVALRVDAVDGIYDFDETSTDESPEYVKGEKDAFLRGIGKQGERLVVLLDPAHVLPESLGKAAAKAVPAKAA